MGEVWELALRIPNDQDVCMLRVEFKYATLYDRALIALLSLLRF